MRVYDTYKFVSEGKSEVAALAAGRSGGSEWGVRLAFLFAFLFVGLCGWAWANSQNIVAWSLSQGLVGEAATSTLPGAVKIACVVGGILGLAAAGLAPRSVRSAVRTVLGYMGLGISNVFRPLWAGIAVISRLVALLVRQAYIGGGGVARTAANC